LGCELGRVKDSVEVEVDYLVPSFGPKRGYRRHEPGPSCVVDENVKSSELVDRSIEQALDSRAVEYVSRHREGFATSADDLLHERLEVALGPGGDRHVGAGIGQTERDRTTNAP
jgi:hypothetical protein